jgi:hypothetical protein
MYVTSVFFKYFSGFKRTLQVLYLDIAYVALAIHVCCKCIFQMFQLFQTYVASVLSGCCICCSAHTHMLQAYDINVSSTSYLCCSKYFMLQVFHQEVWLGGAGRGGPLGHSGPRVHAGSQAGVEQKTISMGVASSVEHEAASMLGCSLCLSLF